MALNVHRQRRPSILIASIDSDRPDELNLEFIRSIPSSESKLRFLKLNRDLGEPAAKFQLQYPTI
jgi:hypothetical protein